MTQHRFRALIEATARTAVSSPSVASPFIPCPSPILSLYTPQQQAYVAEIYRLARERTEAQLQRAVRRLPEFSVN